IGNNITVGVNLELIQRFRREGLVGRGTAWVYTNGRVRVNNKDGLARISRLGEGIQVSEIEARVPVGKAKVQTGVVVRHLIFSLVLGFRVRPLFLDHTSHR